MLQIITPLTKIHRPVRPIRNGYLGNVGTWGYIDSEGYINQIPNTSTSQSQPQVMKLFFNGVSTTTYESNDTKGGKISTLEGYFRASVDSAGFQTSDTEGSLLSYTTGDPLTPAYRITSTPSSDKRYSVASDIGKLRVAEQGDLVVAQVDNYNAFFGTLEFITVSPHPFGGDDIFEIRGTGRLIKPSISAVGAGNSLTIAQGSGSMVNQALIAGGTGHDANLEGSGEMINQALISDGVGVR